MDLNSKEVLIVYGMEELPPDEFLAVMKCCQEVKSALSEKGFKADILSVEKEDFEQVVPLKGKIINESPDVIFNLFEGIGEDSYSEVLFAQILEELKIPFTGNGSQALGECLDKLKVKKTLSEDGINTPEGFLVKSIEDLDFKVQKLKFPLIVKPCFQDASCGIDRLSFVRNKEELYESVKVKLTKFTRGLLVEEFIKGPEYSIGLIGNNPYEVLAISVIDYSKYLQFLPLLTYESKWDVNAPEYKKIIPELNSGLDEELKNEIIKIAFKIGDIFSCRGYFRVDLRTDEGKLFVLDINPNPDISEDAGFARMARAKGYSYSDVIEKIVISALDYNCVRD